MRFQRRPDRRRRAHRAPRRTSGEADTGPFPRGARGVGQRLVGGFTVRREWRPEPGRWNGITGLSSGGPGSGPAKASGLPSAASAVAASSAGVSCRLAGGWARMPAGSTDGAAMTRAPASLGIAGHVGRNGQSGSSGRGDTRDAAEIGLPAHLKLPGRRRGECVQHRPFAGRAAATGSPPAANDRHARSGRHRRTARSGSASFRP